MSRTCPRESTATCFTVSASLQSASSATSTSASSAPSPVCPDAIESRAVSEPSWGVRGVVTGTRGTRDACACCARSRAFAVPQMWRKASGLKKACDAARRRASEASCSELP